jgi:hypothetical protein
MFKEPPLVTIGTFQMTGVLPTIRDVIRWTSIIRCNVEAEYFPKEVSCRMQRFDLKAGGTLQRPSQTFILTVANMILNLPCK